MTMVPGEAERVLAGQEEEMRKQMIAAASAMSKIDRNGSIFAAEEARLAFVGNPADPVKVAAWSGVQELAEELGGNREKNPAGAAADAGKVALGALRDHKGPDGQPLNEEQENVVSQAVSLANIRGGGGMVPASAHGAKTDVGVKPQLPSSAIDDPYNLAHGEERIMRERRERAEAEAAERRAWLDHERRLGDPEYRRERESARERLSRVDVGNIQAQLAAQDPSGGKQQLADAISGFNEVNGTGSVERPLPERLPAVGRKLDAPGMA